MNKIEAGVKREWTLEEMQRLGKRPDREVAQRLGLRVSTVKGYRKYTKNLARRSQTVA